MTEFCLLAGYFLLYWALTAMIVKTWKTGTSEPTAYEELHTIYLIMGTLKAKTSLSQALRNNIVTHLNSLRHKWAVDIRNKIRDADWVKVLENANLTNCMFQINPFLLHS